MNVTVATRPDFLCYAFQKTANVGILPLAPLWQQKETAAQKRKQDIYYPIPAGWKDIPAGGTTRNPRDDPAKTYKGAPSGPDLRTPAAKLEPSNLAEIFTSFLPLAELKKIAEASTAYATRQPVKKVFNDQGVFQRFQPCDPSDPSATTRSSDFAGMSEASLLAFLGCCYLMGAYGVQSIHDPWSRDTAFRKADIADSMTEAVFLQHLHFITFASLHDGDAKDDNPLRKVKPFIDTLIKSFARMWTPGMNLTLDECCIAYKGHLSLVQFNPNKPAKHHIKLFALVCAYTGYCFAVYPYGGKKHHTFDAADGIALDLMKVRFCLSRSVIPFHGMPIITL